MIDIDCCPDCEGMGCPYCGGYERDYHSACVDCQTCGGTGLLDAGAVE